MDDPRTFEHAKAIATLLPTIMRQLFTGDDDPTAELPLAQLRVCSILQHGSRSMSVLSRELRVSLSALTQIADRLERSGLVRRVAEENDRRIRCLQLTPGGAWMMQRKDETRIERVLAAIQHISPDGGSEVRAALEKLLEACLAAKQAKATALQG